MRSQQVDIHTHEGQCLYTHVPNKIRLYMPIKRHTNVIMEGNTYIHAYQRNVYAHAYQETYIRTPMGGNVHTHAYQGKQICILEGWKHV